MSVQFPVNDQSISRRLNIKRYLLGVDHGGNPASLEPRKFYEAVDNSAAEARGMVRVIDESGDDYLCPARLFVSIDLPAAASSALEHAAWWSLDRLRAPVGDDLMNSTAEEILSEAMGLPTELRAFVAEKLIESLDAPDSYPLSESWRQEVRRRCAEIDRDAAEIREASVAFTNAYIMLS